MHEIFLFPKENVTFDLSTSLTINVLNLMIVQSGGESDLICLEDQTERCWAWPKTVKLKTVKLS